MRMVKTIPLKTRNKMIVASKSQSVGTKVQTLSRGASPYSQYASQLYRVPEAITKYTGKYEEYKKYIPSYYEEKYTYKPHKRIAGYLGQTFHSKKKRFGTTSYRQYEKCQGNSPKHWNNCY